MTDPAGAHWGAPWFTGIDQVGLLLAQGIFMEKLSPQRISFSPQYKLKKYTHPTGILQILQNFRPLTR